MDCRCEIDFSKKINDFTQFLDDFIGSKIASRAGETLFLRKSRFFHEISRCLKTHEKSTKKPLKIKKKSLKIPKQSLKNHGFYSVFAKITFFREFPGGSNFSQNFNDFIRFLGAPDPPKSVPRVGETLFLKKPLFSINFSFFFFFLEI